MTSSDSFNASLQLSMGEFSIRPITSDQLRQWAQLELSEHPHPWSQQNLLDSLSKHQCSGLWWKDTLVGYGVLSYVVGEAELLLFVLSHSWRGRGIASAFLRKLMECASIRASTMFLEVRASNEAAIQLYEACGFNRVGVRAGYYPSLKGREDAYLYAAELISDTEL